MKKTKRLLALITVIALCAALFTACGEPAERADSQLEGKYVAVSGSAMGVTITGEEVSGFGIELKKGGKGSFSFEGNSASCSWKNDDTTVTLTVEGTDIVGTLGEDTITFEGFLEEMIGVSMDLTFAKEGTAAAK